MTLLEEFLEAVIDIGGLEQSLAQFLYETSREFAMSKADHEQMKDEFRAFVTKWHDGVWKADPANLTPRTEVMKEISPRLAEGMTLLSKMFNLSFHAGSAYGVLALSVVPKTMQSGVILALMDAFVNGIDAAQKQIAKTEGEKAKAKQNGGEKVDATSDDRNDAAAAKGKEGGTGEADAGV